MEVDVEIERGVGLGRLEEEGAEEGEETEGEAVVERGTGMVVFS